MCIRDRVEAAAVQHHVEQIWLDDLEQLTAINSSQDRQKGAKSGRSKGKGERGREGKGAGGKSSGKGDTWSKRGKGKGDAARYKTDLCKSFTSKRGCQFGDRCIFAHGKVELSSTRAPGTTGEESRVCLAPIDYDPVSYTHLRAHETPEHLVCRLLLEKKKKNP
eukprot:TRINITY_DN5390_c0_g1_i1.p1 TRINITY_DN5390_c0_g1~~TRINITY_DN5390_c0_g1_i1.p1  ORF type:complete len:164 (+),score=52.02 TRINITY_DN5390_c0_g1_i1:193-684(+)